MVLESFFASWDNAVTTFFQAYADAGRPILNALHFLFDNLFNIFLLIMILVSTVFLIMTLYTWMRKKPKEQKVDRSYTPTVTVQIPTCNEAVAIRCAEHCLKFDYPKNKYHILIGDDSKKASVSKKLQEYAAKHDMVRVLKRKTNEGYKAGNLNNMTKYSKGEIIVVFDSDFTPSKDFLRRIVQPFKNNPNTAGVQAKWTFINGHQNLITVMGLTIQNVLHNITLPFMKGRRKLGLLCGSGEAVRKDILKKLGGWDMGNLTEDIEFSVRLTNKGYHIEYLENLGCDGELPYTTHDFYRQQMRWGYGVIYSYMKHFKETMTNKRLNIEDRFCLSLFAGGYAFSIALVFLFISAALMLITHEPGPLDIPKFVSEMARNILLTSGLLITSSVALMRSKNGKAFLKMVTSSFSIGLVSTYYVNKGIFKAVTGQHMKWFILQKKGNESY